MSRTAEIDPEFENLLESLKRERGFDFTGYKRAGLARRFQKRMQAVGAPDYAAYRAYLVEHPDEFGALFNTILINVTGFFRDPEAWRYIADVVLPLLLEEKSPHEPIRVWSAGCASGEEPYTAAMLLAEALGVDQFRDRVKIYGTDVDEEALGHARHGSYSLRDVDGVPAPLLDRYFERTDSRLLFHRELRRNVIFGRNDLVRDAPISRVDLLICRNTLMYLNADAQARIISRFHFALTDTGFLFLGKAEMLFAHSNLFLPRDLKWRVFTKVPSRSLRDHLLPPARAGEEKETSLQRQLLIREAVFDRGSVAEVVVDANGELALANEQARDLFRLSARDLGRSFQDLEMSSQPAELRALIERVCVERRPASLKESKWLAVGGEVKYLDVLVMPLLDSRGALLGVSVAFTDVTRYKLMQAALEEVNHEMEDTNRELETAYEELQSTNEELETTNEELQSINEELETTNEELQSSNEELETMNEELQSTNEEMQTMNLALRQRSTELDGVNAFLASILTSLQAGVAVVDPDLQVLVWSRHAEDMWGLRADEAQGKHFLNLDIGLPVDRLRQPIRACLMGQATEDVVLDAINRRGRPIRCRVTCNPLLGSGDDMGGVILLMEELNHAE
ncbi:MAG: PAS domain-containing protein [Armatimonadetes bacterium]|nr:PAS domain-containing protein [Armatimonadota bacterium]